MAIRTRRSAHSLKPLVPTDAWDPIFLWYAKAIDEMRRRPLIDPTSWRYQAAIHAYNRSVDPLRVDGEALPSQADQGTFWNQCQHATWFFLPWHRMYLGYFEQTIRATIVALGDPDDVADTWALPYWNYSDGANPNARRLPLAFTLEQLPDGTDNPLRIEQRTRGNDFEIVATANQANVRQCLIDPNFEAPPMFGLAGFGGPQTGFMHSGNPGAPMGKLESTPHGTMHGAVGNFMGRFNTAGLDPIFWLHHANIDRLWVVWRRRNTAHLDPTLTQWLTGVTFSLHDANGAVVTHTASEVVDTTTDLFEYEYDNVADPIGLTAAAAPRRTGERTMADQPEMVGATDRPLVLTGGAATTRLAVSAPRGPAAMRAAAAAEPLTVHLNVENVTGLDSEGTYAVYLNVPDGEMPEDHPELFAGLVPMFGVSEATRGDATRPGGEGLTFSLDVTDVVRHLEANGAWTNEVKVTFVPEGAPVVRRTAAAAAVPAPISVGRVSLYFA